MNSESTRGKLRADHGGLQPSVYYAESHVKCRLPDAWRIMLDYHAWNPNFVGAQSETVHGERGAEGEIILITARDAAGSVAARFYAQTVKLVELKHIVWYVYPQEGDAFRNFVDFWLDELPGGVKFSIYYYSLNPLAGEPLVQLRRDMEASLRHLTVAFKKYCEANSPQS